MKRFYKVVSVREESGGYSLLLDSKLVKTPAKNVLLAPTHALADVIMQEWAAQKEMVVPSSMPLTQILSTKIDRVAREREAMTKTILDYLETDLLCYRTDFPPELAARQAAAWDPPLEWFKNKFGAALVTTEKLDAVKQPAAAQQAVQRYIAALDDERFTALQLVTALAGSAVLALGFIEGFIDANGVFAAARVEEHHKDEIYNAAKHGPDPAQEKKDAAMQKDLAAAAEFLALLKA